jgi:hypothetical protein
MKHLLAWPIWYHPDVVPLIVDAIAAHEDPNCVELLFYFDGNDPESITALNEHAHKLSAFKLYTDGSPEEINEMGCHRAITDWFYNNTDFRAVLIHQDDTRPNGPHLARDLNNVLDVYGDKIGYIGCRDGYDLRYNNFISSPWSTSDNARAKLAVGEHQIRLMMNPGPLVYTRRTLEKVGTIDAAYHAWYAWDDYALKCVQAGLTNVILGTDLIHQKYGRGKDSVIYQDKGGHVAKDLALLNARWSGPYNGNVI